MPNGKIRVTRPPPGVRIPAEFADQFEVVDGLPGRLQQSTQRLSIPELQQPISLRDLAGAPAQFAQEAVELSSDPGAAEAAPPQATPWRRSPGRASVGLRSEEYSSYLNRANPRWIC
jgi:hypothetical protein